MPFTITQFRSEISKQKNLARPNLFEVNVTGKAINNALVPFMAKMQQFHLQQWELLKYLTLEDKSKCLETELLTIFQLQF